MGVPPGVVESVRWPPEGWVGMLDELVLGGEQNFFPEASSLALEAFQLTESSFRKTFCRKVSLKVYS